MYAKKIALVTGNFQGLGKALSDSLTKLGYEQPQVIRSKDYDLKQASAADRLIKDTIDKYGRLDLLINNVGNYVNQHISSYPHNAWREMFASNVDASFYLAQAALPYLRQVKDSNSSSLNHEEGNTKTNDKPINGRIINIGYAGIEKFSPSVNTVAYQAAKTALLVLTKGLAKAEVENRVLVNMLSPGYLENTVIDEFMPDMPLERFGTLAEACKCVHFILDNDYLTGENISLAGGWGL
jgi:NAD(P)-dependent dehydrogenase (short-subunit alcohol dehydrogenase family)